MGRSYQITLVGVAAVTLVFGTAPRTSTAESPAAPGENGVKPNLIVNGSFETGPEFEGNFLPIDEDSAAIRGWVVTRGQIDLLQDADGQLKAAHGKRSLDLHGSPGWGGVEQSFETKVGKKYQVTFRMSGNPGLGYLSVQMAVRAAGTKKIFECDMEGKRLGDLKWETKTWTFTAIDTLTVLEFRTAMTMDNPFGGPLLDDVQVSAMD